MKGLGLSLLSLLLMAGCSNRNAPDVSSIQVDVTIERFDKYFFEKADTNQLQQSIAQIRQAYPYFAEDFLRHIVGIPPLSAPGSIIGNASGSDAASEFSRRQLAGFIQLTHPLYDSIAPKFSNTSSLKKELTQAFKYVKYYFPAYQVPKIVTYVGPFDAPGVAVTEHTLAIGLQLFAGKNFSYYTSPQGQEQYPSYISRRFEPEYILPNCMKAVVDDLFPDNSAGQSLVAQMIEKGKRWYLLDLFLPDSPDSLKTDYTEQQLKWCDKNEGLIWNFILSNTDIYTTEAEIIKNYIGEAPQTDGMPDSSPGNIGQWIGWQIIKTYVAKHPELTPEALMKTGAKKIFDEAKYKPK